jgi:anthranilate phosphoribosyltransferase
LLHSFDGYDEISLTADFKLISKRSEQLIQPAELGFKTLKQEEISGGTTVQESAKLFLNILNGEGTVAQNNVSCVNAAMAIHCVHPDRSVQECLAEAKESLQSKKALQVFKQLINHQ